MAQALGNIEKLAMKQATSTFGPFSVFGLQYSSSHADSTTSNTPSESPNTGEGSPLQETYDSHDESTLDHHDDDGPQSVERSQSISTDIDPEPPSTPLIVGCDAAAKPQGFLPNPTGDDICHPERDIMGTSTRAPSSKSISSNQNSVDNDRRMTVTPLTLAFPNLQEAGPVRSETGESQNARISNQMSHYTMDTLFQSRDSIISGHHLATALFQHTTASMLMHHYTKHVVHVMQPVFHPRNPFSTIYLPLAVKGSSGLELVPYPDRACSASITVFHSLLSTAATSLRSLRPGDEDLQQLACQHKQHALISLQSALATQSSSYKDLMTAILSLVSADVSTLKSLVFVLALDSFAETSKIIDGGTSDHWIHLEAGVQLQSSRHYPSFVSRETRLLNNICRMLKLFAQTTLARPNPKPWPGYDHTVNGADFTFLEPSIEFLYGITTSIAGAIFKVYRLTQSLAYYKNKDYPESLMQACETLGDELHSWTVCSEPFSTIDSKKEHTMLKIAWAQARAFYYATLIYYYRSVQKCARERLSLEQQAAIVSMNEAEDLKLCLDEESSLPAPITWPAFIASCEAVNEERRNWDRWWSRVQKYRMGNYYRQQCTVRDIWAKLDSSETPMDWREALKMMDIRIIPV